MKILKTVRLYVVRFFEFDKGCQVQSKDKPDMTAKFINETIVAKGKRNGNFSNTKTQNGTCPCVG